VARAEDLDLLAREARARGLSLGRMLGELVATRAEELRQTSRPRLGTFRAEASIAALAEVEEPAARAYRS
jgi:hypothetical protein